MSFPNKRKFQESVISFETSSTSEQNKEKMLKITVNAPKKENLSVGIGRGDSVKGEEVLVDSKGRNSQVVTNVNRTIKGQGMTFTSFLNGQGERNSVKQQNIGNSAVVTLPYSLKSSSNLGKSQATSSSISSNVFAPLTSPKIQKGESLGKTSYFKQQKEINALKNAHINNTPSNDNDRNNGKEPKVHRLSCDNSDSISEVLEMIDIDNTHEDPFVNNENPAFSSNNNKTVTSNTKALVRPTLIQTTERGDSKSNSKMKLRDYLYMVEAKSKHSSKKSNPQDLSANSASKQGVPPTPSFKDRLQRSSVIPRKDCQKYSVSNAVMFDILKKEIHDDINHVMNSLMHLDEELLSIQPKTEQPPNQDLLVLYSIRRQIKEEMHKKLQAAIESIKTHKKSIQHPPRTQRQRKGSHV